MIDVQQLARFTVLSLLLLPNFQAAAQSNLANQAKDLLALAIACPSPPSLVRGGGMEGRIVSATSYVGTTRRMRLIERLTQQWHYTANNELQVKERDIEISVDFGDLDAALLVYKAQDLTGLDGNTFSKFTLFLTCLNHQACVQWPDKSQEEVDGIKSPLTGMQDHFALGFCNMEQLTNASIAIRTLIRLNSN